MKTTLRTHGNCVWLTHGTVTFRFIRAESSVYWKLDEPPVEAQSCSLDEAARVLGRGTRYTLESLHHTQNVTQALATGVLWT